MPWSNKSDTDEPVMTGSSESPRRVFRADTPADVLCANLLLEHLPEGENTLAFCTDKTRGHKLEFASTMRAVAQSGPWARLVDISGLPINRYVLEDRPRITWRERVFDVRETVRIIRQRMSEGLRPSLQGERYGDWLGRYFDEVLVTCIYHDDVRLFGSIWNRASKAYYPHTLGSLDASEVYQYPPFLLTSGKPRRTVLDLLKWALWGRDAMPVRAMTLARIYTLSHAPDWGVEVVQLGDRVNRETLARHYLALPESYRMDLTALAERLGDRAGLLLLAADEGDTLTQLEREAHERVVRAMFTQSHIDSLLIKPHPRNSVAWCRDAMEAVESAFPELRTVPITVHSALPIEVIAIPMRLVACGGLGSTSFGTLKRALGLAVFCAESAFLESRMSRPLPLRAAEAWVRDSQDDYSCV